MRLWFRPPANPQRPTEPGGARFEVDVAGHTVVGHAWGTGETVYLMHGWGGRAAQLDPMVAPLVAAGFRVISFDAPNHGDSEPGAYGRRGTTIPEFAEALTAVVAAHGPGYAVVAHSLGCTATAVAIRDGLAAKRLVFIAPMASPIPSTPVFAQRLGFGERIRRRLVRRVEQWVGLPFDYFDVPAVASQVTVPPLLVVHDKKDLETPYAGGEAIAATWQGSRLVRTEGLGHHRILRDAGVITEVVRFLENR